MNCEDAFLVRIARPWGLLEDERPDETAPLDGGSSVLPLN
jgi:hypothetical protein